LSNRRRGLDLKKILRIDYNDFMNNITLIAVGALKNKALQSLAADYQKRIKPYARLQKLETPASPFRKDDRNKAKKREKEALEKVLHRYPKESIFILAETGRLFYSVAFSNFLSEYDGRDLVFLIGGALGWEEELALKYPALSLSPLTFPHELARVVLLEQIYRGLLLKAGKEYHY